MDKQSSIPPFVERKSSHKSNKKALIILFIFFIIVLIVLFFQSSLSEIQSITVSGEVITKEEKIIDASRFKVGAFYFSVSATTAQNEIKKLPTVKDVVVKKNFPGKVSITVTEYGISAYLVDEESNLFPVLDSGYVLPDKAESSIPNKASLLTGWKDRNELSKVTELMLLVNDGIKADISEIHRLPTDNYPKQVVIYTRNGFEIHVEYDKLDIKLKQYPLLLQEVIERQSDKGIFYLLGDVARFESYKNVLEEGDPVEESNEDEGTSQ